MDFTGRPSLENETFCFMACMRELAEADKSGDPVRQFWAIDELACIALHTGAPQIKIRADAELMRRRSASDQPVVQSTDANEKLITAVEALRQAGDLPSNCMVTLGPDGSPQIHEL